MAKPKHILPPNYDRIQGKHFVAIGKEPVAGPFETYDEADQAKARLFPTGRHPETGARVDVCYHPTLKQMRQWDRLDRSLDAFHVTYWQVMEDRNTVHGRRIGAPLSRKFSTKQKCRGALARIKGGNPRAYMCRATYMCHWGRPSDIKTRRALLQEIRRGESRHA